MSRLLPIIALILLCLRSLPSAMAQAVVPQPDSFATFLNTSDLSSNSSKLLTAIKENRDEAEIARDYADLADVLIASRDYARAEVYISKAIHWEKSSKAPSRLGEYHRRLARIRELQKRYPAAEADYRTAAQLSADSLQSALNRNDAERMRHIGSPKAQLDLLTQNAFILSSSPNSHERVDVLNQMAAANLALNRDDDAIANLNAAANSMPAGNDNVIHAKNELVNILASNNNVVDAVALQKQLVSSSTPIRQAEQLRRLSTLYFSVDSAEAGLKALQQSYQLALAQGQLLPAKTSLQALATRYLNMERPEESAKLYADFVRQLDGLIARDSSLFDWQLFSMNEERIAELETQQALQAELIRRQTRSNWILAGSVVLLLLLLALAVIAWRSIRRRNLQIALQALRREMNPHFIFNSLNSVNQFIAHSDERAANRYLGAYSALMRSAMENSNKDYLPLSTEIELLQRYLELEQMRFPDKFDFSIEIDDSIDPDQVLVPNMVLQPNLENAIWHGLRYRESKGILKLRFQKEGARHVATIEDNGIGLKRSDEIKTQNQRQHQSRGLHNVRERIRILNQLHRQGIQFDIHEKSGAEGGVIVKVQW